MKTIIKSWISPIVLILIGVAFFILNSCKKDNKDTTSSSNQFNEKTTARFSPNVTYSTVTDIDGNIYKTVIIGTQTWMAENLRTTHYRNGDSIPNVTDNAKWRNLSSGAYCNINNTQDIETIATYGRLYNGYTVKDSRNIAPTGWHVATDNEWITLCYFFSSDNIMNTVYGGGGELKETTTTHWHNPNYGATNESGFTALPGGLRISTVDLDFNQFGIYGYWWTSSMLDRSIYNNGDAVSRDYDDNTTGMSVRCVKN